MEVWYFELNCHTWDCKTHSNKHEDEISQFGLALITTCLIVTLGGQMSQFGLVLIADCRIVTLWYLSHICHSNNHEDEISQFGLALITTCLTLGGQMSQFGLVLVTDCRIVTLWYLAHFFSHLGVDEQSAHFESNCHSGRPVTVDQSSSGCSVQVKMSLGCSVGGRLVKAPYLGRSNVYCISIWKQVFGSIF